MNLEDLGRALSSRPFGTLERSAIGPGYRGLPGAFTPAAVLVPLFEAGGEPRVLLTRRRGDLRRHPGQISFPGGRVDEGDPDSLSAALREAREEVGIEPGDVAVLGRLSETLVVMTGFLLTPWVGLVPYPYPWVANPGEVAEVIEAPLADLERAGAHWTETREVHGMVHELHFFTLGKDTIWGATARILFELLTVGRSA